VDGGCRWVPERPASLCLVNPSFGSEPNYVASDPFVADPEALGMMAHPEGGWYRETWRHDSTVETSRGERPLATAVAFLLLPGERSAWHRVASAEMWLWQGGGPVQVTLGGTTERPMPQAPIKLGPGGQLLVPADTWQAAEPADQRAVLVACIVSPGFDFADFTLADP
jgi:predicted cupin superfamily sugar epimerase